MSTSPALESKLTYLFLRIVFYLLLFTPLWVLSVFLFPFITTKVLYFRLLIELAVLFYVPLAVAYPELRPRWNWLTRMVWIYLGVIILASIFGVNFSNSFWGTIERGEGIITILHFVIYFTILPCIFRSRQDWYRYFAVIAMIIAFTAVYGFAQLECQDFVPDNTNASSICRLLLPTQGIRISATIGNAAFFGAFLLFGIFSLLYLIRETPKRWPRFFFYGVCFFELYILFETQTRGAVLAAAVAFALYFLFAIFRSRTKIVKLVSLIMLLALVTSGLGIYKNRDSAWIQKNQTIYRLATISLSDITTQSRLDTWQASWLAWKDRFVLGYGYENYHIAFNKYFPARIFKDQGSQIWFDRAHNIFFDITVASGITGLLAYLGIFVVAFWYLFKLLRKKETELDWQLPVILAIALVAYFLQNLFVFDTQATYLVFFLLLAYVAFLKNSFLASPSPGGKPGYHPGIVLPSFLLVGLVLVAYFVNLQPALANYHATMGIKMAKLKQYREVQPEFKQALSYGTYMDQEIRQRLVDYTYEAVNSGQLSPDEQTSLFQYAIAELQKSLKSSPRDVKNYLYLMNVLNRFGNNPQALNEVFALGKKALELSPTRPQIYFELGQAAFSKKDFEAGLRYFQEAVSLNPEPKESHFNYLLAGIIAKRDDIVKSEIKIITQDLSYGFNFQDYLSLARAYLEAGDNMKVIENYQAAAKMNPQDAGIHARLAAAYKEVCDLQNAEQEVAQAVKLDSTFTLEAQEFLRQLEAKCKK